MNKVIQGKKYDTQTAKLIGAYETNELENSDVWYREELYQKQNGEFFLTGQGGCKTQYAVPSTTLDFKAGEKLEPLVVEEAEMWCEEHLSGDEYEKIFGMITEDGSRATTYISLPVTLLETLRAQVEGKDESFSEYIEGLILKGLDKE